MRGHDGYLFQRPQAEVEPVTPAKALSVVSKLNFGKAENVEATAIELGEATGGNYQADINANNAQGGKFIGFKADKV
jgi:hypothetical protein